MKSVLIIYATVSGNTEMVSELVANFLSEKKVNVILKNVLDVRQKDIKSAQVLVLASPTYGHGELPANMDKFTRTLTEKDLKNKYFAVIGLGDPKYEMQYHLESARILTKILTDLKGEQLLSPLMISGSPVNHINGFISNWSKKFLDLLKK